MNMIEKTRGLYSVSNHSDQCVQNANPFQREQSHGADTSTQCAGRSEAKIAEHIAAHLHYSRL